MHPDQIEAQVVDTWDFGDVAATEDRFHALLTAVAPTSPHAAVLLTQVARTHGLRGDFDAAHAALDTAAGVIETLEAGAAKDHAEGRLAIERGRAVNAAGLPAEAVPYFEAAYEFATRASTDGLAVDALHMTAIAVGQVESVEESAGWNLRAIDFAESSDDPAARKWLPSLLNNLGWDRHGAGAHDEALALFKRALTERESVGSKPEITIARWAVARALRALGRLDEALTIQRGLAADPDNADDGYIPEEIGECLVESGRIDEAAAYFASAHQILSRDEWLVEHEPERLARLAAFSRAARGPSGEPVPAKRPE